MCIGEREAGRERHREISGSLELVCSSNRKGEQVGIMGSGLILKSTVVALEDGSNIPLPPRAGSYDDKGNVSRQWRGARARRGEVPRRGLGLGLGG